MIPKKIQLKPNASALVRKPPVAPPAYQPQPVPVILQRKLARHPSGHGRITDPTARGVHMKLQFTPNHTVDATSIVLVQNHGEKYEEAIHSASRLSPASIAKSVAG